MTSFFDKLNLRPAERRVLVAVMLALFVVVNLLWVWPRFGDWKKAQNRFSEIKTKMDSYERVIKDRQLYESKLRGFESGSQQVPPEDQVMAFSSTFQQLAPQCGVFVSQSARPGVTTNENFIELTQRIPVTGDEAALVMFLYRLGDSNSAVPIRVKEFRLQPAPQRQKLSGEITLVASFQRKLNLRAPVPGVRPTAGTPAPVAATGSKSGSPAVKTPSIPAVPTNRPPTQTKR